MTSQLALRQVFQEAFNLDRNDSSHMQRGKIEGWQVIRLLPFVTSKSHLSHILPLRIAGRQSPG